MHKHMHRHHPLITGILLIEFCKGRIFPRAVCFAKKIYKSVISQTASYQIEKLFNVSIVDYYVHLSIENKFIFL